MLDSRHPRSAAFTLLEVLLALMLFALSAVVLGAAYLNVLNGYQLVRKDQAVEEDLRFVRSIVLQEPDLEELERGGDTRSLYLGQVHWRAVVEPTPVPDLFYVRVEIGYEGADGTPPRDEVEELILLRPDWSDPAERSELRADLENRLREIQEFQMPGGRQENRRG